MALNFKETDMRGDKYDDYARQLRKDEHDRLFRLLHGAVVKLWRRAAACLRARVREMGPSQSPRTPSCGGRVSLPDL